MTFLDAHLTTINLINIDAPLKYAIHLGPNLERLLMAFLSLVKRFQLLAIITMNSRDEFKDKLHALLLIFYETIETCLFQCQKNQYKVPKAPAKREGWFLLGELGGTITTHIV